MLRNLENAGNPWGMPASTRLAWTDGLSFDVTVIGPGQVIPDDVEYLFWVGCAGASDDRARHTTRAIAELLHIAGVRFAVLGPQESCTGDPARRMGNEFVYQELAKTNIETLTAVKARKIVASCPHCFNTIGREYPQLGGNFEVVHHTELLAELVAERPAAGDRQPSTKRSPTTTRVSSAGTTRSTTRPATCSRWCPA